MRNWVDIPVSHSLLKGQITEGYVTAAICKKGLPKGAVFVRSWYDVYRDIVHLVYEHPSFDEVPEGEPPPQFHIEFEGLDVNAEGQLCCAISGEKVF